MTKPRDLSGYELEMSVLGCVLSNPAILPEVLDTIKDESYFHDDKIRGIYKSILERHSKGESFDYVILGQLGHSYIFMVACVESIVNPDHGVDHAVFVKDLSQRRQLKALFSKATKAIDNPAKSIGDILALSDDGLSKVSRDETACSPLSMADIIKDTMIAIDNYANGIQPEGRLYTGISNVDKIARIMPGNLVLIGGWAKQGKTQLALQIAQYNAVEKGVPTLIFSLEMKGKELGERFLLREAKIDQDKMLEGKLTAEDHDRIVQAQARLSNAPLMVHDTIFSLNQIISSSKKEVRNNGIKLIIVDYVQLVDSKAENRRLEVALVGKKLKQLAAQLDIPVIMLSQLTDLSAQSARKKPVMADVSESKSIKNDANVIMLIWREDEASEAGEIKIIARNGPDGKAYMTFHNGRWEEGSPIPEPEERDYYKKRS